MSLVFRYVAATPPAPFVLVTASSPDGLRMIADRPAKVDCGADRTIIPAAVAEHLALQESDRLRFAGLGGVEVSLPVYDLLITIRGLSPIRVEVAASEGEPYILLGLDVMNYYRVVLDGPN